jgi:hypothetical protein
MKIGMTKMISFQDITQENIKTLKEIIEKYNDITLNGNDFCRGSKFFNKNKY